MEKRKRLTQANTRWRIKLHSISLQLEGPELPGEGKSLISEYFHLAKQVLVLGISVQKELLLLKFNCQDAFSYHEL